MNAKNTFSPMAAALAASLAAALAGCISTPVVQTVEPWEGRYSTVEEFRQKTENLQLKENQSVWVLSNGTMYRILRKVEK